MKRSIALVVVAAACGTQSAPPAPAPPSNRPAAAADPDAQPPSAELGAKLFSAKGCVSCHSADGSARVGPTLKGLLGSKITLVDGTTVVVDEARFRARTMHQLPDGVQARFAALAYTGPSYRRVLTPRDLDALVAYARTLSATP